MSKIKVLPLRLMIFSVFLIHYNNITFDGFLWFLIGWLLIIYAIYKKNHIYYLYHHYNELENNIIIGLISTIIILLLYIGFYRPQLNQLSCYHTINIYNFQPVVFRGYVLLGIGLTVYFLVLISLLPEHDKPRK